MVRVPGVTAAQVRLTGEQQGCCAAGSSVLLTEFVSSDDRRFSCILETFDDIKATYGNWRPEF